MLKSMLQQGDIAVLKLLSGEEVIGKVEGNTTQHISISFPLSMMMVSDPRQPSTAMIAFAPFMLGVDSTAHLPFLWSAIIVATKASAEAARQYQTKSPTGAVVLPPEQTKRILVG